MLRRETVFRQKDSYFIGMLHQEDAPAELIFIVGS